VASRASNLGFSVPQCIKGDFMKKLIIIGLSILSLQSFALSAGDKAPAMKVPLTSGNTFELGSEKGKVVLIQFWATWCDHCQSELPVLSSFLSKHKGDSLEIIAVSMDESSAAQEVAATLKKHNLSGGLGNKSNYSGWGKIRQVPTLFVVDKNGVVQSVDWIQKEKLTLETLEKHIAPLLSVK